MRQGYVTREEAKALTRLSKGGGQPYFERLSQVAVDHVLRKYGIDHRKAASRTFASSVGVEQRSNAKFTDVFAERYGVSPSSLDLNRQWRLVFVAPRFAFQNVEPDRGITIMKHYLTNLYVRGMRFHFVEYRLFAKDTPSGYHPPWTLAWRFCDEWKDQDIVSKNEKKAGLSDMEFLLDEFALATAKSGHLVKKWPGYNWWDVVRPNCPDLSIKWPLQLDDLTPVALQVAADSPNVERVGELVRWASAEWSTSASVEVSKGPANHIVTIRVGRQGTLAEGARKAAAVLSQLLTWWQQNVPVNSCELDGRR